MKKEQTESYERGRMAEREAILRFLRAQVEDEGRDLAVSIARGEHEEGYVVPVLPVLPRSAQAEWGSKVLRSKGFCGFVLVDGDPPREVGCILPPGHDDGAHGHGRARSFEVSKTSVPECPNSHSGKHEPRRGYAGNYCDHCDASVGEPGRERAPADGSNPAKVSTSSQDRQPTCESVNQALVDACPNCGFSTPEYGLKAGYLNRASPDASQAAQKPEIMRLADAAAEALDWACDEYDSRHERSVKAPWWTTLSNALDNIPGWPVPHTCDTLADGPCLACEEDASPSPSTHAPDACVPDKTWGCEARAKLGKARGALIEAAQLLAEAPTAADLEIIIDLLEEAVKETAQPQPCAVAALRDDDHEEVTHDAPGSSPDRGETAAGVTQEAVEEEGALGQAASPPGYSPMFPEDVARGPGIKHGPGTYYPLLSREDRPSRGPRPERLVRERDARTILAAVVQKAGGIVVLSARDLVDAFGLDVECVDDVATGGRRYRTWRYVGRVGPGPEGGSR